MAERLRAAVCLHAPGSWRIAHTCYECAVVKGIVSLTQTFALFVSGQEMSSETALIDCQAWFCSSRASWSLLSIAAEAALTKVKESVGSSR